ncbi:hypothetical protein ALQ89_03212 [Pseudomonas amygdali pv. tabaci]|uniref:Uncharacterized protein n=1 Tax=Pseudomonas amygdali pv. tabaci TaxID=322 RepID=A0AAX1VUJ6_PSEAJ|nr:hypothetical protein ALO60_101437 [Pseudomonas amygdali pv. tabaci]RML79817.1 hypothetical protein ALQ89_03212 [Pseudomonas amygdali pv. tabaci]RMR81542.1 hypothetical protein ALP77_101335 [Pseudomonas amygdali pv. tabaci]
MISPLIACAAYSALQRRAALEVVFSHFEVMPALGKDLHDLT